MKTNRIMPLVYMETRIVLRITLSWLAVMAFQALIWMVGSGLSARWDEAGIKLRVVFQLMILVYPILIGLSLFSSEKTQSGMEYLLALPFSHRRIVFVKVLVRLAALLAMVFGAHIFMMSGSEIDLVFQGLSFTLFYFVLFAIFLSLSAMLESTITTFVLGAGAFALSFFLVFLAIRTALRLIGVLDPLTLKDSVSGFMEISEFSMRGLSSLSLWAVLGLMMLPFLAAFAAAVSRLDLRVAGMRRRFGLVFWLLLAAVWLASTGLLALTYDFSTSSNYYLTRSGALLEFRENGAVAVKREGRREKMDIGSHFFSHVLLERNGWLYLEIFRPPQATSFVRMNPGLKKVETLFEADPGYWIYQYQSTIFDDSLHLILTSKSPTLLGSVDLQTGKVTRTPLRSPLPGSTYRIAGLGRENGRLFTLLRQTYRQAELPLLRIWPDGTSESIPGTAGRSALLLGDRLLVFGKKGLRVFRPDSAGDWQVIHEDPELADFDLISSRGISSSIDFSSLAAAGQLLIERRRDLRVLHLADFSCQKLRGVDGIQGASMLTPSLFLGFPGGWEYVVFSMEGEKACIRGRRKLENMGREDQVFISNAMIVRRRQEVSVYRFPDLQEMPRFRRH